MKLHEIREARAAKVAEARNLIEAANGQNLSAEAQTKFDGLKAEIQGLEAAEQRAVFLEEAERRSAGAPVDKQRTELESRISLLDAINAQVEQRAVTGALAEYQQEAKRNGQTAKGVLVPASAFETRSNTTTTADGIVPKDFRADQFIGLLRNSTIVRSLGVRTLTGLRGDVVIPKQTSTSAATWLAEGDALSVGAPLGFNTVTLSPKHVGALAELSRQLLQQSSPDAEKLVRDDLAAVIGLAVDKALLHGTAAAKQPIGIVNATGIQTASLATLGWANVLQVQEKLTLANIAGNYWLTTPQVATKLRSTLKASTAGSAYLMENGQLAGLPVAVTQQLDNKTAGEDVTGRAILGDFSELVIGQWGGIDILANPYADGPYSRGAVQIRIMTTLDAAVRRPEAFVLVDDIAI
ncbi:capsid protein [Lampropedia cohaerens]|uniref:Capsid protein n=1 Tax=Lampropedia cohaerens TaxID=1610491 RepID=A0A0U1PWR6_9BURK|nr:phage major capsid protein [Lampropedia cohaerens]KKW66930.1 capsid protein [Lampropedia cohaerens]